MIHIEDTNFQDLVHLTVITILFTLRVHKCKECCLKLRILYCKEKNCSYDLWNVTFFPLSTGSSHIDLSVNETWMNSHWVYFVPIHLMFFFSLFVSSLGTFPWVVSPPSIVSRKLLLYWHKNEKSGSRAESRNIEAVI